jgi:hypothetical protein
LLERSAALVQPCIDRDRDVVRCFLDWIAPGRRPRRIPRCVRSCVRPAPPCRVGCPPPRLPSSLPGPTPHGIAYRRVSRSRELQQARLYIYLRHPGRVADGSPRPWTPTTCANSVTLEGLRLRASVKCGLTSSWPRRQHGGTTRPTATNSEGLLSRSSRSHSSVARLDLDLLNEAAAFEGQPGLLSRYLTPSSRWATCVCPGSTRDRWFIELFRSGRPYASAMTLAVDGRARLGDAAADLFALSRGLADAGLGPSSNMCARLGRTEVDSVPSRGDGVGRGADRRTAVAR